MKKIYLSLLGAMMAMTASAQQKLLNTYTVEPTNNQNTWFSEMTYNEKGLVAERHDVFYYDDSTREEKTVFFYDDQWREMRRETYEKESGDYKITSLQETIDYDAEGRVGGFITYYSYDNTLEHMEPYMKYIVKKYNGVNMMDYDVYMLDEYGINWVFYATVRGEEDSRGEMAKLVQEIYDGEYIFTTTLSYEYDDHLWLTKETYDSYDKNRNYVNTYENFYDADGTIEKRNRYRDGQWTDTQYYVWGDPTAIQSVKPSADDITTPWYDLNGRRLNAQPTKKGLYIRNGKKIIIK